MAGRSRTLEQAFGAALRESRDRVGLSQEALAHAADVHATYVSQLERGLKSPSLRTIAALARALRTRPHLMVRRAEELAQG